MSLENWKWKISEATKRIRSRYEYIGRKTGAPFLAVVYSPELEIAARKEWNGQASLLSPEFNMHTVNVLEVTEKVIADIGPDNIVSALREPMPGSDPQVELGTLWIKNVADAIRGSFSKSGQGKPVVTIESVESNWKLRSKK